MCDFVVLLDGTMMRVEKVFFQKAAMTETGTKEPDLGARRPTLAITGIIFEADEEGGRALVQTTREHTAPARGGCRHHDHSRC